MAQSFDDGVFWLPPQFLVDEDTTATPLDPYGFSPPSELSSPLESLGGGSSETESDEEDQIVAELTRRMARSCLNADFKPSDNSMGRFVTGSPLSTLCAFGSGCGCRKGSNKGSPNDFCKVSSSNDTWDLLHAAAEEVERMRLSQVNFGIFGHQNGLFVPQRKPSPVTLPSKNTTTNPNLGVFTQQSLSPQQVQIAQMLRQQQMAKEQNPVWNMQQKQCGVGVLQQRQSNQMALNRGRSSEIVGGGTNTKPLCLSQSAWPSLQHATLLKQQNQQYGSGMRAVFLNNPSGRRECAGTGVFLPRRVDRRSELRKKPACSTVLVPNRVAQALNLNLDDVMEGQPQHLHRFNATSNMENAAGPKHRSNYVLNQQKRNLRPQPTQNHEIRLPQEWTY